MQKTYAETLTEYELKKPHALLFRVKCEPVANFFAVPREKNVAKLCRKMKKLTPSISLNGKILSNVDESLQKEWIITNGLGGYASST
ncbi:MAG: hypothetical protein QW090_04115, partial [Candidatus Bathyarchaeia archaeon]